MKQLFSDIIGFMKNLNPVDFLLYFSILILIILVVSLIYIIKTSDEEEKEVFSAEEIDLKEVVNEIEESVPPNIPFTSYEKDQEEKAIISYEELLAKNKTGRINYNEEAVLEDDISVKKIDLDHIINAQKKIPEEQSRENSELFKFAEEEAFLKALKTLNKLLN